MIRTRLGAKAQTTVPLAVRRALGLREGDELKWELDDTGVRVARCSSPDPFVNNFATFSEWASEADCEAFDNL
jgi:antitoxin PrlF